MKRNTTFLFTAAAAATALLLSFPTSADAQLGQLINIDINGDGIVTMTGAAVLGTAGDFWNGVGNANDFDGGVSLTGISLVDSTNTATAVTFDLTSGFIFDAGGNTPFTNTPHQALFQDFTGVSDAGVGTITLRNLAPGAYDLVIYAAGDFNDGNGAQNRIGSYTANGLTASIGPNSGSSVLIEGTNYARFSPLVGTDGLLNISFTDLPGGSTEADVSGLQLQAVPEPSALLMLGSGAGMFALLRRRRS